MKEIIYNHDNIRENNVDETVVRVKAVIINSKKELMLGYCDKTYQFPGGHLEKNESLTEGLIREIKEETGIDLSDYNLTPFKKIIYYVKNYRNTKKTRKNELYFFLIKTDEIFNKEKTNLDKFEKENNYTIKMFPLDKVKSILIKSIPDNPINKIVVEEMLEVLKEIK